MEHDRPIKKKKAMLTARKIMLSAAIVLSTAFALATSAAFAKHPEALISNVTAANRCLSDVYWLAGSGPAAVAPMEDV